MNRNPGNLLYEITTSVLHTYSVVFFFNNRILGVVLLIVTFFNFNAGLSGLTAVLTALLTARAMGFNEAATRQGIYSFNSLLTGIGIGTFFDPGTAFIVILLLASLISLMISVILGGWFGKNNLPFLSIPFVLSFWIILLPSGDLANLGLTQRNVFWINEMYSVGGNTLLDFFQTIENFPMNRILSVYLRSLSSIIFQDNILTGILIAVALLVSSRIAFLLSLTGFITAWLFASIVGSEAASLSFYNIGANYILVAIAAGGFYTLPSKYSFLWVILLVPLTSLLILFLSRLVSGLNLPLLSLPFSIVVISFIYFLMMRIKQGKLILTPFQNYSPEINLYTYKGNIDRNTGTIYHPLQLPLWGEWTVYQGYDGPYTHKGDWSKALDFVLTDDYGNTLSEFSGSSSDYYCYNKPVLSPADGIVSEIIDNVNDNQPGKINTDQNWGNTIVVKHDNNLYTQLSHLRPGTFRVAKGDFVRKGDILANCGNSGRSPEPHLHFQVQTTPVPGARPIAYPFSYYFLKARNSTVLKSYSIPSPGEKISKVTISSLFHDAYDLQPGMILRFRSDRSDGGREEWLWEVFTDQYNNRYLYCRSSKSAAYFVNDGTMFYFTAFYGNRNSLLYYFYLASYRVLLGYYKDLAITDQFPLHNIRSNRAAVWIQDMIAPFWQYMKALYRITPAWADSPVNPGSVRLGFEIRLSYFSSGKDIGTGTILISDNRISEILFESPKTSIWAQRSDT